jgi:predicted nucleic acid-binding protein
MYCSLCCKVLKYRRSLEVRLIVDYSSLIELYKFDLILLDFIFYRLTCGASVDILNF